MNIDHGKKNRGKASVATVPDIVIDGGLLLPMAENRPPISPARVEVKGGKIINITQSSEKIPCPDGAEIIDAREGIIMPGLINAHTHTAMTIFRGLADDLPLKQWLFEKIFPAEAAHLNPETVYWGTLLGCLEMIASGTTTMIDGYFFQDDTARAVHQSGLRALIAQGVIDFPAPGVSDPRENLRVGRDFVKKWLQFSELIRPGLFCHSPLTCSEKTLRGAMEISGDHNLPLQTHLSETREEVEEIRKKTGQKPLKYLDSLGLANENLIAAHAVHLDNEEMDLLAAKGVRVVHVPESNMKLAAGVARIPEMVKMGVPVGIGTDSCASNNNLDLFQEMDTAAKLHKVCNMDPVTMNAETVMKMATSRGAKILGLENEIGTIEKGKRADIIVLDLQSPHMIPLYNPISTLVYSANGGDVKDVIVNGRVLMKERIFMTLDPEEIMGRVREISRKVR